jgi:hypothetical protein
MNKILLVVVTLGFLVSARADEPTNVASSTAVAGAATETIVCLRHGEKPPGGLGQLNCRGLNRALALPKVLLEKYGTPQFVFAPNPLPKNDGKTGDYNYIRPLMTIEPTAVRCGLPVNTQFGFKEIKGLENELAKPAYRNATIFIAWEHELLDEFVKNLVKTNGGDPALVPPWLHNDYDTLFLVKITRRGEKVSIGFTIDHEGLTDLSENCP